MGIDPVVADWHDDGFDWGQVDLAVVRSTWDYTSQLDEFIDWAEGVSSLTQLANPLEIIRWNTDKRYLLDLASNGVPVVTTEILDPQTSSSDSFDVKRALLGLARDTEASEIVVKPAVSAGARDTERYSLDLVESAADHAVSLLESGRAVLLQPYLSDIDTRGETGLVFSGNVYSHAFNKAALLGSESRFVAGHYREETIRKVDPSAAQRDAAGVILDAITNCVEGHSRSDLLYARVDLAADEDGNPLLLELELTEPSLFCSYCTGSADRFAAAIFDVLQDPPEGRA